MTEATPHRAYIKSQDGKFEQQQQDLRSRCLARVKAERGKIFDQIRGISNAQMKNLCHEFVQSIYSAEKECSSSSSLSLSVTSAAILTPAFSAAAVSPAPSLSFSFSSSPSWSQTSIMPQQQESFPFFPSSSSSSLFSPSASSSSASACSSSSCSTISFLRAGSAMASSSLSFPVSDWMDDETELGISRIPSSTSFPAASAAAAHLLPRPSLFVASAAAAATCSSSSHLSCLSSFPSLPASFRSLRGHGGESDPPEFADDESDDRDLLVFLEETLYCELKQEEAAERFDREQRQEKAYDLSLLHRQMQTSQADQAPVLCPLCFKSNLDLFQTTIICKCGFSLRTQSDALTLYDVRHFLNQTMEQHRLSGCQALLSFSLQDIANVRNLWAGCRQCDFLACVL